MDELTNTDIIDAYASYPQELIEGFGDEGDLTRQHLLNPAIFELLGDVRGRTILDAGCGQGYLCRLLARAGASVTGVEPVEKFYTYARRREQSEQLGIHYIQADLSTWIPTHSFDFVIANMVLMDIPDYESALKNCVAALRDGGGLIFSLLHPCFEEPGVAWKEKSYVEVRDYFRQRAVPQTHGGYFIHRPLSTYLNSVINAGCALQRIIEPRLDQAVAERHHAERYASVPGYIIIYAIKQPL
ncbi:class I SAM-dependent methyltransferase [Dictyobacter aurantiacus]|uniref:Class I SAM-dependent methyltransferase n=1 Tax=Dictyobacter aurantiacus TaxID=1936993 RepID=A0A401ZKW0_9CHLR|nr:class I SAM-dependent methyltransferase [Dictyobacter aurantiacus]GCE07462.1 class I SAM-dependent methyltransferase [Dictyobacter aurantiacus]